jgi:putative endonuclease
MGAKRMTEKLFYVYILTNKQYGTLYIGMTENLPKRIWEHKNEVVEGYTKKYQTKTLVYFEVLNDFEEALKREKKLKKWPRQWKLNIINEANKDWKDLYEAICQ